MLLPETKHFIRPCALCVILNYFVLAAWTCVGFEMMAFVEAHFSVHKDIGLGYWDLSFIDHSDNFQECNCFMDTDLFSICGTMWHTNLSLCEERQFATEVLSGQWAWDGLKRKDVMLYNLTNPSEVASGSSAKMAELTMIPFLDKKVLGSVDRAMLDEQGILSFSTMTTWSIDVSSKPVAIVDKIIMPHVIFSTLLANGMFNTNKPLGGWPWAGGGYPSYYPLLNEVKLAHFFAPSAEFTDYITTTYSDGAGALLHNAYENLANAYYASERHGLQGLSFVKSVWDGEDKHCGYDRDCMAGSASTRVTSSSLLSCAGGADAKPNCEPTMVKKSAHGLEYGISSLRTLPGATFWEISKVEPGGELAVFDYTAFNKAGTEWPALETAFFVTYNVILTGEDTFMALPVLKWTRGNYDVRQENCGGGGDSPGVDCSTDPGMVNVGPSMDAVSPPPLYLSPGAFTGGADIEIAKCGMAQCNAHDAGTLDLYIDKNLGSKYAMSSAYTVSLKLATSNMFSNKAALVPLYWMREYCAIGQFKLNRALQYDKYLDFTLADHMTGICATYCGFHILWLSILICKMYRIPRLKVGLMADWYCT
eukprot:gnl/MRDRNA2_/MRDRNA2_86542_c1_seq1.p1 gnl/MRDRNA2_/MRDRNA2_86542_c1~~gnl/MRDRNA2_/MRDRNA2_86542_c1_seq1.p1  ORF type:complete len:592 (+),score=58.78 gnl/MRDRNA2_/MRDRNA2_86542_c1_seq1:82-1857(+)